MNKKITWHANTIGHFVAIKTYTPLAGRFTSHIAAHNFTRLAVETIIHPITDKARIASTLCPITTSIDVTPLSTGGPTLTSNHFKILLTSAAHFFCTALTISSTLGTVETVSYSIANLT